MEHDKGFDYAGNAFSGSPYSDCSLLTTSIFNPSDFDFSDMLNFTPPIEVSEMAILNIPGSSRSTTSDFLGDSATGRGFPFPTVLANMYNLPSTVASTITPVDLSMPSGSNFPIHGLPRPLPPQDQSEPQSASVQVKQRTGRQVYISARPAAQKRAQPATISAGARENRTPKRRRGTRKKVRTEEEIASRRKNHLQRNRDAAQKCRQQKKLTEAAKKEQMAKERHDNHIVWNQVGAVHDELDSLRNYTLDVVSHCQSSDHRTAAKISLELIKKINAKLQDQIDMCNQRRAQISEGLFMQRSFGGYTQQDSMQDGPRSTQDSQLLTMSSRKSSDFSEHTLRPGSTRGISYATRQLNTGFATGNELTRKKSNNSSTEPDSVIDLNSLPIVKDLAVEDEAVEIPVHETEESLPLRVAMGNNANSLFALLTQMQHTGGGPLN